MSTDAYGRTVVEQARRVDRHPSAIVRWARKGYRLRSGTVVRLQATALPGGYRITDEALDAFVAAITTDRLAAPDAPPPRTSAARRRAHEHAEEVLARSGI